jgi:hypothetical protein
MATTPSLLVERISFNPSQHTIYVLLISSLVLFLLDIVVRKFNFLWPHEIVKKVKDMSKKQ